MTILTLCLFAFFLGSVPFGELFARRSGVDLRKTGSGNIGATNVLRSVGRAAASLTLLCDVLKGSLPVLAAGALGLDSAAQGIVGLSAVLGHDFSLFRWFRGGKGVATSIGVLLVYSPLTGMATIALWLLTVAITRYSSLGAILAFAVLPLSMYALDHRMDKVLVAAVMTALLIVKHAANIQRLIQGTESKVGKRT